MIEFIDSFAIANTARMVGSARSQYQVVLVERYSDVRQVDHLIGKYNYVPIAAHGRSNLVDAVEILSKDGWKAACTQISDRIGVHNNLPAPLGLFPWLTNTLDEIAENAQELSDDKVSLAVFSANPDDSEDALLLTTGRQSGNRLDKTWRSQNDRRVSLIKKRLGQGLDGGEQQELDQLQAAMSRQVNALFPLPFDALDRLEKYVEDAERRHSEQ